MPTLLHINLNLFQEYFVCGYNESQWNTVYGFVYNFGMWIWASQTETEKSGTTHNPIACQWKNITFCHVFFENKINKLNCIGTVLELL